MTVLFANENLKSNRPIICYGNLVTFNNVSATYENTSYPVTNLTNPSLNSRWESTSADDQYITANFASEQQIDYVAFAGHDFATSGALVSVEVEISSVWIEVFSGSAISDYGPTILRFDPVDCDGVRLKIATSGYTPTISVFYAGLILDLERNIYVGHTPINYGLDSDIVSGMSENGQFIGRIVTGERYQTNVEMNNITPGFYRTYIEPFFVDAVQQPFFFAWRPLSYPQEISYCWFTANGRMVNELSNGMVSISFPIQGIIDGEAITTAQPTSRTITISEDVDNLNLRTLYDSLFPTPLDTTELTVVVESGVVIGSTTTAAPALDIGSWPSGTTIDIDLAGRIQGAGGAGGDAPDGEGNDGGDAINASRAVTIDLANGGEILDGAGGGAADATNGGGGGAGSTGGAGGAADGGAAGVVGGADTGGTASGNAGAGGDAGLAGNDSDSADGGDSGCTIDDYPLITVINSGSGTIEGCNVNTPTFGSIEMTINSNQVDYNLRTAYDGLSHPTPDSSTVLNVEIESGVVISASDTATPAFDVGTWPSGATITIYVNGTIKGAGGDGGDAPDGAGSDGGVAFETTVPVTIDFADQGTGANGIIAGGGGGGEAGSEDGGGGGAGAVVGNGGSLTGSGSNGADGTATTGGVEIIGLGSDVMPTMTGGTTSGVTVSAHNSLTGYPEYEPYKAADDVISGGTTDNVWHSNAGGTGWIKSDLGSATDVLGYTITAGNGVHVPYAPTAFTFEGSDNDSSWMTLDTQSGLSWSASEKKTFDLGSSENYRYYRINITAAGSYIVINEFELLAPAVVAGGGGDLGEDGYDASGAQGGAGSGSGGAAIDGISNVTKLNTGSGTITGDEV